MIDKKQINMQVKGRDRKETLSLPSIANTFYPPSFETETAVSVPTNSDSS